MRFTTVADTEKSRESTLPKQDWIVLPGIGLLTILLLGACTELIGRYKYSEYDSGKEKCQVYQDPYIGIKRLASCDYWAKPIDSQVIEFRLNRSGYREESDFPPKSPGSYRIVLVGSSYAWGGGASKAKSIAGLLPTELSKLTGRKIELYNESIPGFPGLPQNLDKRLADVVAAQPDLVLWVTTRWDVKAIESTEPDPDGFIGVQAPQAAASAQSEAPQSLNEILAAQPRRVLRQAASWKQSFGSSASAVLLQHLLYLSPQQVASRSFTGPDDIIGYLKSNQSPAWAERLKRFDVYAADIAARSHAAGASLAMVMMPTAENAAMISSGEWPAGFDPYKLDSELKASIESHGGVYLDIIPEFRNIPDPQRGFGISSGHPNAAGEAILSNLLVQQLTNGRIPALARSGGSRMAQRQAE